MRLDKYLKISLIFKTRSSGEKEIDRGNVLLNDNKAKPSSSVKAGDKLTVIFPLKKLEFRVLKILDKNVSRKDAKEMYEVIGEEQIEF